MPDPAGEVICMVQQDKRLMIIQEIRYWKKHKLLPEQYCDFLLNLYGGEDEMTAAPDRSPSLDHSIHRLWLTWMLFIGIIAIISIIVLNFNAFPLALQITLSGIGIILLLVLGIVSRSRNLPLAYLSLGAGCLLMLLAGEWILRLQGIDDAGWAIGYLTICCVVWIAIGAFLHMTSLQVCGAAGILFVYSWWLFDVLEPLYGLPLQAAWIAASGLFLLIAWLFKEQNRSLTRAAFIIAVLAWLMPEVMAAVLIDGVQVRSQVVLAVKIFAAGIALVALRNRWMGWFRDR